MGGGVPTDIISGEPRRVKSGEELLAEAQIKEAEAIQEASLLIQELNTSPVMAVLAEQFERRLATLAKADPECQTLLKVMDGLSRKLAAPALVRRMARQRMGPQLGQFIEDSEAAPD
jgi:hypothetical protein